MMFYTTAGGLNISGDSKTVVNDYYDNIQATTHTKVELYSVTFRSDGGLDVKMKDTSSYSGTTTVTYVCKQTLDRKSVG